MTDHDALLRAICEHPAEDTPRLVFADWLDEHADALPNPAAQRARAAFIRADIAASQRDEYDPARLRWELIDKPLREAEPWVKETLPPLRDDCSLTRAPLHRRGFVWSMEVKGPQWMKTDATPADAFPLEAVTFQDQGYSTVRFLSQAAWRNRLEAISFKQGTSGIVGIVRLLQVPNLDRLTYLSFHNDALNIAEVPLLISARLFRQLRGLEFDRVPIGRAVAESLIRHGGASALRALRIVGCHLPAVWLTEFLAAPAASNLEVFAAGGDRIGAPEKFRAIARANTLSALRSLDMSADAPKESGLEAFLASPLVSALQALNLSRCSLNSDRTRLLADGAFDNLRVLTLTGNSAGNAGAAALARSPHLTNLLVLDLSFAQVGDEGITAIMESPLVDSLVLLNLHGSPASAEMKELVKARMGDRVRV